MYKSRSAATAACQKGRVRVNRVVAKAATPVKAGDRIEVLTERRRVLEVVTVIDKRVGAAAAAACLVDHTPPLATPDSSVIRRERGAGRPTKRERREIDRLRS